MLTMDDIKQATPDDLADPITLLKDADYRWQDLQAIRYDPSRTDLFPGPSFLTTLWERCKGAGDGRLGPLGILPPLFCGVRDLSCENIISLLRRNPLFVLGEWRAVVLKTRSVGISMASLEYLPPVFHPLGFCFPTGDPILAAPDLQAANRNAIFAGYAFFDEAWRTRQQRVLTWLGIAALFGEFRAGAIHGVRFHDNHLTARWMRQYGFMDLGTVPQYLARHDSGDLTAGVVSTLARARFSGLLTEIMTQVQTQTTATATDPAPALAPAPTPAPATPTPAA